MTCVDERSRVGYEVTLMGAGKIDAATRARPARAWKQGRDEGYGREAAAIP